ncbi:MAG: hypothetical protein IJ041_01790 [Clostridia bacterium]|nr:hypothetical protein [Clostridia bacterium]
MKRWTALLLMLMMLMSMPAGMAEETAEIEWYPGWRFGNCFFYGERDENDNPCGFIVYEDNQGNTHYGVNLGSIGTLWDGVCIIIHRDGNEVDSITLHTYDMGFPYHAIHYYRNGNIVYDDYMDLEIQNRYHRQGETYTVQEYYAPGDSWSEPEEIDPEEINPKWGMGYASITLESDEQKLENGLHVGTYLLTGVTDEGATVEILRLEAGADGSVEYTLDGESWRYDHGTGRHRRVGW